MAQDKQLHMEMLRRMMRIRHFEERVIELAVSGEIVGAAHSYIGEEAVAVGACLALRDDDYIAGNHRSHGHPIAKGGDVNRAMAELLGKRTGYCKGKGGSMHLADFSIGILGESGIVGSSVPVAVGAAMGAKMQGTDRVSMVFYGDGASNQGAVAESMNLASIWKLPTIFLCENNQYAQTTHFRTTVASEHVSDRAAAYNIPAQLVDGQDVVAMHRAVSEAVERGRAGGGPSMVEALTYRYQEHSEGMARIIRKQYRSDEEQEEWRQRDPIKLHKERVLDQGTATETEIAEMEEEETTRSTAAVEFARESPYPEASELFEDMYAVPIPVS